MEIISRLSYLTLREFLKQRSQKQGLRLRRLRLAFGFTIKNIRFRGINRYRFLFHGRTFFIAKTLLLLTSALRPGCYERTDEAQAEY